VDECTPVFSLSFHADYSCHNRGACCTAGWPIPVESAQADALNRGRRDGRLQLEVSAQTPLFQDDNDSERPRVLNLVDGACVCYARPGPGDPGRCHVQRALGHAALPLACRQFPRVTLVDPRGVFVTLSHYCPTAAEMLARPGGPGSEDRILESPAGFPRGGEYEGLDARANMPPLLRPDMLMDWESWSLWEQLSVEHLARGAASASASLAGVRAAVEIARTWSPARGPLAAHLTSAYGAATGPRDSHARDDQRRLAEVLSAIPPDVRDRFAAPRLASHAHTVTADAVRRRFLAAHAFANWTAHLGLGLRTWLRSLESADALVSLGLGIDGADLLLRHLADPAALARTWSAAETDSSYSADMNG